MSKNNKKEKIDPPKPPKKEKPKPPLDRFELNDKDRKKMI